MQASKNELLSREEEKNKDNVFLSDLLKDVLSESEDDFDFDQSLNKFNFAYLHFNEDFYKSELIELDKKFNSIALIAKCGSEVIKAVLEEDLDKVIIEFSEDYVFEVNTVNLRCEYNIKVLNEVNSYIVSLLLSEV